jgi:hypothetical protein
MATSSRLNLTRDQLASFLQDHEQIRQFERLFALVDELRPTTLNDIAITAGNADQKAVEALDAVATLAQDAAIQSTTADQKAIEALNLIAQVEQEASVNSSSANQKAIEALNLISSVAQDAAIQSTTAYQKAIEALNLIAQVEQEASVNSSAANQKAIEALNLISSVAQDAAIQSTTAYQKAIEALNLIAQVEQEASVNSSAANQKAVEALDAATTLAQDVAFQADAKAQQALDQIASVAQDAAIQSTTAEQKAIQALDELNRIFNLTGLSANSVLYLNASKIVTTSTSLTFDGTNFATTGTSSASKLIPTGGTAAGNGMYLPSANTIAWSNNGFETMRLDSSGNLGLGVTPSAWGSNNRVFQLSNGASVFSRSGFTGLSQNLFYDSSDAGTYIANGNATLYFQNAGQHVWNTAPSGTAGNAISFTQAMTLDASGRLLVGGTSAVYASNNGAIEVQSANGALLNAGRFAANANGPALTLFKSRNATVGGNTIVVNGDTLGEVSFVGANGTGYDVAASIRALVDGTPGASADMPGSLTFSTSADGSATPTERARITSAGNQIDFQPAESAQNTSVTLSVANLQTRVITSNAAVTLTLPTGTSLEGYTNSMTTDTAFEVTFIATTANAITIAANGNTTVGNLTVSGNTSGVFRFRRTALNTFTVYRVA